MEAKKEITTPHSIALFPGAFRPPHANHYETVEMLCARQDIDEVVVIVTNRCRNLPGSSMVLDVDIALKIWSIYLEGLPKARVELAVTSAVKHALGYFERINPGTTLFFCAGERDLKQGDGRFKKIENLANKYTVNALLIPGSPSVVPFRATQLREMLLVGGESRKTFISALPRHLKPVQKEEIWSICQQGIKQRCVVVQQKILDLALKKGLGKITEIQVAKPGKTDQVFRVQYEHGPTHFVKYAHDTEKAAEIGKALSLKPKKRLKTELNAIKWIRANQFKGIEFPDVVNYDRETKTLMLSEVCPGGHSLQDELDRGLFDPKKARQASRFLAQCSASTIEMEPLWDEKEADLLHWRAMLALRTTDIELAQGSGQSSRDLEILMRESDDARRNRFVHLDYCPNNILFRGGSIGVIDFELSSSEGDPAYDLGFFLSHYIIAGSLHPSSKCSCESAIQETLCAYREEVGDYWISLPRVTAFAGASILYNLSKERPAATSDANNKLLRIATYLLAKSLHSSGDKERILLDAVTEEFL